jgi:peptidoglycan/LPS O-acetylase OafA/YrhL
MSYSRVNEIDLLRFVAALAVLFFHYAFRGYAADGLSIMPYPWLAPAARYGYLGANLFFIISGFVILMSAEHGSLRSFVVSRIVRLYPAFWACCTITFVLILSWGAPHFHATTGQYLANMTMLNGFMRVDWIDGSYWTLFVEMKFYGLVGVVLAFGRMRHVQAILVGWLLLSVLGEFWPNKYLRYFLIVDYAAYFIAGATCFLIWSRGLSCVRAGVLLLCWGLALFQSTKAVAGMVEHYHTDISNYVAGGLITAFFAVMLLVAVKATGVFGRRRWLAAGALTYPLYLLHQNAGFIVFNRTYPAVNAHVLLWGTLALMLAAAWVVHVQVERRVAPPLKHGLERLAGKGSRVTARFGRAKTRTAARDSGSPTPP